MWVEASSLFPGAHEMLMERLDEMIVQLKEEVDEQQERCHQAQHNYIGLAIRQAMHPTSDSGRIEQRAIEIDELLGEYGACVRALRAKQEEYERLVTIKAEWESQVPAQLAAAMGQLARQQVDDEGAA